MLELDELLDEDCELDDEFDDVEILWLDVDSPAVLVLDGDEVDRPAVELLDVRPPEVVLCEDVESAAVDDEEDEEDVEALDDELDWSSQ